MPKLSAHQSSATTKLLLLGDSGAGKTGALASLASAGYNLRIIDTDNGVDILANLLKDPASRYAPEALDRVTYQTITDKMRNSGGKLVPSSPSVWNKVAAQLNHWKTPDEDLGAITDWGHMDVLVLDSLTTLSTAALNFVLAMNGRLGQHPQLQDWGGAQSLVETLLQLLYDDNVKCNVVVIDHMTQVEMANGTVRLYPNAPGKALAPKIGRYFNTVVMVKTAGSGKSSRHEIVTLSEGNIELKTSSPTTVKASYPIETGLAQLFDDLRAATPPAAQPASSTPQKGS